MEKVLKIKQILNYVISIIFILSGVFILIDGVLILSSITSANEATSIVVGIIDILFSAILIYGGVLLSLNQVKKKSNKFNDYVENNFSDLLKIILGVFLLCYSISYIVDYARLSMSYYLVLNCFGLLFSISFLTLSLTNLLCKKTIKKEVLVSLKVITIIFNILAIAVILPIIVHSVYAIIAYSFIIIVDLFLTVIDILFILGCLDRNKKESIENENAMLDNHLGCDVTSSLENKRKDEDNNNQENSLE